MGVSMAAISYAAANTQLMLYIPIFIKMKNGGKSRRKMPFSC